MCVDFSLDLVCSRCSGTVRDFRECFEKSLYGRNLLLTIQNLSLLSFHGTSDSPPMKGLFCMVIWLGYRECVEGS